MWSGQSELCGEVGKPSVIPADVTAIHVCWQLPGDAAVRHTVDWAHSFVSISDERYIEEIGHRVSVQVRDCAAGCPSVVPDSGRSCDFGKRAVTVVHEKLISIDVRDVEILKSVVVEVSSTDTLTKPRIADIGQSGDFVKFPPTLISVEMVVEFRLRMKTVADVRPAWHTDRATRHCQCLPRRYRLL